MSLDTLAAFLAVLGGVGGLGGLAALLRARSQNRVDDATTRRTAAEADQIEVRTAREMVAELREEMERRVSNLTREIGRLQGRLEHVGEERDRLRREADDLHRENVELRARVEQLEERVRILTTAAELAEAHAISGPPAATVRVAVETPESSV